MPINVTTVNVIIGLMLLDLQRPEKTSFSQIWLKIMLGYCHHLVNMIRYGLAQSDHFKWRLLCII